MARLHDFLLVGLAPDAVHRVELVGGDNHWTIGVNDNLFHAAGNQPILLERWLRSHE